MKLSKALSLAVFSSSLLFISACDFTESQPSQTMPQPQAPTVNVAAVVEQSVSQWNEFTGRLQAPQTVELRPRVSGYIDMVAFEEGARVNPGDALFLIDNRPYKAEVKRLQAQLVQAQSQLQLAKRELVRAQGLIDKNAISRELLDAREAAEQQAQAQVSSVRAALELAKLDLSYTHVTAPIGGRVSRAQITKGNYVTAGQTSLTTLVSTSKVYAYFDADEQTYLKFASLAQQHASEGKVAIPVFMGLATDDDFPYQGHIDFIDNQVDQTTGTIRVRAVFDNTDENLIPGLFARIKLVEAQSQRQILINDKAIGTDLSNKYVLVLNQDNVVQYRPVTLGKKLHGLRIIEQGLSAGDRIVVSGLQKVRPGVPVNPVIAEMAPEESFQAIEAQQARVLQALNNDAIARQSSPDDSLAKSELGG